MTWSKWQLIWCLLFHRRYTSIWKPRSQRCRKCGIYIRGPVPEGHATFDTALEENVVPLRRA